MAFNFPKSWKDALRSEAGVRILSRGALVLGTSYVSAAVVSAITLSVVLDNFVTAPKTGGASVDDAANISLARLPNYRNVRRAIMDRNIFNSEGTFPDEEEPVPEEEMETEPTQFNADAPCVKTVLNLTLMGTIVMGRPGESVATVREQGFEVADVYRMGDIIIGHEGVEVHEILRNKVVLNNKGKKECLEMKEVADSADYPSSSAPTASVPPPPNRNELAPEVPSEPAEGGEVSFTTLDGAWVEAQLGPGFGKVINDARLVPHMINNEVQGFKIFAIRPSSLLARVGLRNGDIITQVNDVSLKKPDQGFALYQAFQDEKEINLNVLRSKNPKTLQVRIE